MNKNTVLSSSISTENVNGVKTLEGFNAYSDIKNKKIGFDLKLLIVYLVILALLITSTFIFASSIYTAYSGDVNAKSTEADSSFDKIKAVYQSNGSMKVQPIDNTIAEIYKIPVGIKIIELDYSNPNFNGLRVGDIIVACDGKSVFHIDDLAFYEQSAPEAAFLSYKIFRNGAFRTITPFDQ